MMSARIRPFAYVSLLCASVCVAACAGNDEPQLRVDTATSTRGMVVSEAPQATRIGRDILSEGGKAMGVESKPRLITASTGFSWIVPGEREE